MTEAPALETTAPPPAPVRTTEPVTSPERKLPGHHFTALHGAILLGGEALNPANENIPEVTKEALDAGSSQILNECATNCRRKVASVEADQLPAAIIATVKNNTEILTHVKDARWRTTLTKLLGKEVSTATEADVRKLFDRYFYQKDSLGNDSNTELFAQDVLDAFKGDLITLEANADCISFFARICGFDKEYAETVTKHEVIAHFRYENHPDELVKEFNEKENGKIRGNRSYDDERAVKRFIWGNRGRQEAVIEPKKTTPPLTEDDHQLTVQKADYEKTRNNLDKFLVDQKTKLNELNFILKNYQLAPVKEEDLTSLRTDPEKRKKFIIDLYLGYQREIFRRKIEKELLPQFSDEEQIALEYLEFQDIMSSHDQELAKPKPDGITEEEYQKRRKQIETEKKQIEAAVEFPEDLITKIQNGEIKPAEIKKKLDKAVEEQYKVRQPEIDAEIAALNKQIYLWEGMKDKEVEEKSAEQKPETSFLKTLDTGEGKIELEKANIPNFLKEITPTILKSYGFKVDEAQLANVKIDYSPVNVNTATLKIEIPTEKDKPLTISCKLLNQNHSGLIISDPVFTGLNFIQKLVLRSKINDLPKQIIKAINQHLENTQVVSFQVTENGIEFERIPKSSEKKKK